VFDPIDIKPFQGVVDPVENSIIPDAMAIAFLSGQLQTARRERSTAAVPAAAAAIRRLDPI
jgi:hypothetical protein